MADFHFQNLLNKTDHGALCSLLVLGKIKILLECGVDDSISPEHLRLVLEQAKNVDYILLSHSSWMHVGALPYLTRQGIDGKKVIATSPVAKMGAQTMHELFISRKENPTGFKKFGSQETMTTAGFDKYFQLDDIEESFESIDLVSYHERKKLSSGGLEIILRALESGNSVGGTAWHLEFNNLSIIYAIDLNDKETSLSPPVNFSAFQGANIMISNAYFKPVLNGVRESKVYNYVSEEKLKNRLEDVLVDMKGSILIPVSSKNRILHLLVLLENIFTKSQKLQSSIFRESQEQKPVLYLEHMSKDTLDVAKSHLIWMNFKGGFQEIDENPFAFKNIQPITTMLELKQEREQDNQARRQRVIVTSSASLDYGFGRELLREFLLKEKNMVVFTEQELMLEECLARQLLRGEDMLSQTIYKKDVVVEGIPKPARVKVGSLTKAKEEEKKREEAKRIKESQKQQASQQKVLQEAQNEILAAQNKLFSSFKTKFDFSRGGARWAPKSLVQDSQKLTYYGIDDVTSFIAQPCLELEAPQGQSFQSTVRLPENRPIDLAEIQNTRESLEMFNRLKHLQEEFSQYFSYEKKSFSLKVNAKVCFIPFDARFDEETFQYFLHKTNPKCLILLDQPSQARIRKISDFCKRSDLQTQVIKAPVVKEDSGTPFSLATETAVSQVAIDEEFFSSLPLTKIEAGATNPQKVKTIKSSLPFKKADPDFVPSAANFSVARIQGSILLGKRKKNEESELLSFKRARLDSRADSRPSLFFRENQNYSLRELQTFLKKQSIMTILMEGCLSLDDKVFIYLEEPKQKEEALLAYERPEIRFKGELCPEYFQLRRLVYQYFGKL